MKNIKQKSKTKKNNARFPRVKFGNKESGDSFTPDLSQLRKPIDISVSSLLEVTKLLEIGGDEVKTMLAYECDVVYECRVCRSLFRSLANFISHKRVYCTKKFNVTLCKKIRNEHIISAETFITDPEVAEDSKCKEDDDNMRILRSQAVRKCLKKDLTSVVDMLKKKRNEDINESVLAPSLGLSESNLQTINRADDRIPADKMNPQVLLEAIDSTKSAVYQTATTPTLSTAHTDDLMKAQIVELQNMVDQDTAVLNSDGRSIDTSQSEKSDSPLQTYGSDDDEAVARNTNCARDLVCSVCNAKFATRKTLTYHMKSLHVSYRTCYPCPCCNSTFANSWSVYRHLFKVHRKTNEQVRKLRTQIQEKAFRKEATGAEDIEKENATTKFSGTPEQQTSNDTQEWMEHFELDLELQRCGGCGRRFERKAALISHSQLCQKRIAACNEAASGNKAKRLSKIPSPNNVINDDDPLPKDTTDCVLANRAQSKKKRTPRKNNLQLTQSTIDASVQEFNEVLPEIINTSEMSIRVENISRISDADWEMIGCNFNRSPTKETSSSASDSSTGKDSLRLPEDESHLMNVSDSPEIIFTSIDEARTVAIRFGCKKQRVSLIDNSEELSNGSDGHETSIQSSEIRDEMEIDKTNHLTLMENRIATIANLRKLQCLPCRRKFTSMTNLRRHMAIHIGWHRYRCRLCDFKCFVKCDCVAHCNKVHDAKNNRAIIADMVIQIPPEQSTLAKEIMMDLSKSREARSEPELIDVTASSPKSIDVTESTSDSDSIESHLDESKQRSFETLSNSVDVTEAKIDSKDIESVQDKSIEEKNIRPIEGKLLNDEKSHPENERPREKIIATEPSNQARGILDKDPDLRKMVMEVIFGTGGNDSTLATESGTEIRRTRLKAKIVEGEESNTTKQSMIRNNYSKNRNCLTTTQLKGIRPQRPTRNRVKPVHEDFIYDLTELIRKESAIHRGTAIASQKNVEKKAIEPAATRR